MNRWIDERIGPLDGRATTTTELAFLVSFYFYIDSLCIGVPFCGFDLNSFVAAIDNR